MGLVYPFSPYTCGKKRFLCNPHNLLWAMSTVLSIIKLIVWIGLMYTAIPSQPRQSKKQVGHEVYKMGNANTSSGVPARYAITERTPPITTVCLLTFP